MKQVKINLTFKTRANKVQLKSAIDNLMRDINIFKYELDVNETEIIPKIFWKRNKKGRLERTNHFRTSPVFSMPSSLRKFAKLH